MEDDLILSEGHSLWLLLGLTYSAILKHRNQDLNEIGVSTTRSWILWVLSYIGRPATIAEMSQMLNRDHLSTSQLLRRMENEGLVERCGNSKKRSPLIISMTAKGQEILLRSFEKMTLIDDIMLCLNQKERDNLRVYLNRLFVEATTNSTLLPHIK